MKKKHLVYAEDILYEIMQYPHTAMNKCAIKSCLLQAAEDCEISIWQHIWYRIKSLFMRGN